MAKLIFGCGYLGLRVARRWLKSGQTVFAVTRSVDKAQLLAAEGISPIVADLLAAKPLRLPADVRTVLFSVGYDRKSSATIRDVYAGGMARALQFLPDAVERFVYISTTGVYGQTAGEEVDEQSPTDPIREGGMASLAAEQHLAASRFRQKAVVLRLAGLYGPGRIPRAADLVAGKPIDAPSRGWLNLIHVDDAAMIVLLAEAKALLPQTYVVSDGHPVLRDDYYAELARILKVPTPQFIDPAPSSPAAQRAASDKRVNPRRLFVQLARTLSYPSYREGLAAIVAKESVSPPISGTAVA
jgi:nucleoside-diphosphate-sugar epimerase